MSKERKVSRQRIEIYCADYMLLVSTRVYSGWSGGDIISPD